jgi:hypothetical protein
LDTARLVDLVSPNGLILGKAGLFLYDAKRIRGVVERIAKGLLWHHYRVTVPPNAKIETHFKPDLNAISDFMMKTTLCNIGGTVFRYRHARPWDAPENSFWGMQFYERAHFIVTIIGKTPLDIAREAPVENVS